MNDDIFEPIRIQKVKNGDNTDAAKDKGNYITIKTINQSMKPMPFPKTTSSIRTCDDTDDIIEPNLIQSMNPILESNV